MGAVVCGVVGFRVVGVGVFSLPHCVEDPVWGCCLSVCWFLLSDWIGCSIRMVLCSRQEFWSPMVAFTMRIVFMVAAMFAISVCILCSVRVRLEGVIMSAFLPKAGWRGCLVLVLPLGVGLSKSSSMCEMSESTMEEAMSLSPSLVS